MDVCFASDELDRLEADSAYTAGFSGAVVKSFRKRMQQVRAATDERDFYALKSLHFEKLSGARQHQHSMRLNEKYRLVVEIERHSSKVLRVIAIEDYH